MEAVDMSYIYECVHFYLRDKTLTNMISCFRMLIAEHAFLTCDTLEDFFLNCLGM